MGTMKLYVITIVLFALLHSSNSFMNVQDFDKSGLKICYDRGTSPEKVNGQEQPLPNSLETFIALIERLEARYLNMPTTEIIKNLLISFRVDDLSTDFRKWSSSARYSNDFEKAFFGVPDEWKYPWKEEDFTQDEKCALHFMLSHTLNATSMGKNEELMEDGTVKQPRESGLVGLHSKWKNAFALNKVLLGILAGLSGNNQLEAVEIFRKLRGKREEKLVNVKVNRIFAVTIGDVVADYNIKYYKKGEVRFLPNGMWNDLACPTHYIIQEDNKKGISSSLLRGAVDGLLIGTKLEEQPELFRKRKLSEILRMYYGPTGVISDADSNARSDTQWCARDRGFGSVKNRREEVFAFFNLYTFYTGGVPVENSVDEIGEILSSIDSSPEVFSDVAAESSMECGRSEATADRKCQTPFDVFAILDWTAKDDKKNFQIEIIGNLSTSLDVSPRGNLLGVYTNVKSQLNRGLHTIINNTGISGCQSCFAKYYPRSGGTKIGDVEIFQKLNETLADYVEFYDNLETETTEVKSGTPAKVVLYFAENSSPNDDYRLRDAVWEIEKNFREVTILALGSNAEGLKPYTINDQTDIFVLPSSVASAEDFANKLKIRMCKVPAEFRFKDCYRSNRANEAENRQENVISVNKKEYWAMYPKYFLKSFYLTMKFKPQDGAQIKVCFSRSYYRIIEDNAQGVDCYESSGDEIKFNVRNPCQKRNEHNCDPFYFSVEGKKAPNGVCENEKCRTPKDILFEFQHEGISCNTASWMSISTLSVLFMGLAFMIQKHLTSS